MRRLIDTKKYRRWLKAVEKQLRGIGSDKSEKSNLKKSYVYVDALWWWFDVFFSRILFAKGMQNENESIELGLLVQARDRESILLARAIDAEAIGARKIVLMPKAILISLYWYLFWNKRDTLTELELCGVKVGVFLLEHLVRFQSDLDDADRIRIKDLRLTIGFVWGLLSYNYAFNRHKPYCFIAHETDYWGGAITQMVMHYGAKTVEVVSGFGDVVEFEGETSVSYHICDIYKEVIERKLAFIDKIGYDYIKWTKKYYNDRLEGNSVLKGGNVYKEREKISRARWCEISGADPAKKNIVIMAHCFSDASYTCVSRSIYKNFYEWLIKTLEIIQDIDNVNWILKAHPNRYVYNEGDRIYEIFRKYSDGNHIQIMNDCISTASLLEIADGAVTVCGTCGVELSVHGIPVVCTSNAPYGGYGFTIDIFDEREYVEQLKKMDKIERLTVQQTDMARKVSLPYMTFGSMTVDSVEDTYYFACKESRSDERNDVFVSSLLEALDKGIDLHSSYYFKKGMEFSGNSGVTYDDLDEKIRLSFERVITT